MNELHDIRRLLEQVIEEKKPFKGDFDFEGSRVEFNCTADEGEYNSMRKGGSGMLVSYQMRNSKGFAGCVLVPK